MIINAWATTDVGKTRDHNEDNFLVDGDINLYVVADGMGGHAAGEVASSIAAETVREAVVTNQDLIEAFVTGDPSVQKYDIAQVLEHAVQAACSDIFQRAQNEPEKKGMGTTLSLLLVAGDRGFRGPCRRQPHLPHPAKPSPPDHRRPLAHQPPHSQRAAQERRGRRQPLRPIQKRRHPSRWGLRKRGGGQPRLRRFGRGSVSAMQRRPLRLSR